MNALDILLNEEKLPTISDLSVLKEQFHANLKKGIILTFEQLTRPFDIKLDSLVEFENWYKCITELTYLSSFLILDDLEELIFDSTLNGILITGRRREKFSLKDISTSDFATSIEYITLKNNIKLNFNSPFSSNRINLNNSLFRVSITHPSISADNIYKITFRKIAKKHFPLDSFIKSDEEIDVIRSMFNQKSNILIAGSTGSGKTSFISSLIQDTNECEHLLILEDTDEIKPPTANTLKLLAQKDQRGKTLKDYCNYALRLSPTRFILGEMRSDEVVPFTLLMNCGHRGLISTIHSDSSFDVIERMTLLFSLYSENPNINELQIKKLICKNIDYIIYLDRKKVSEISKVIGFNGHQVILENILEKSPF